MAVVNGYSTLAKIKALAAITSTDATDDGFIEDLITQASRAIDTYCGRTFYARTETHYYDLPDGRKLYIDDDDLLTVTSVTNGDTAVIASTAYHLEPANTTPKYVIALNTSSTVWWTNKTTGESEQAIKVIGTWGYSATTPMDIEAACNSIVTAAYHRRSGQDTSGATITAAGVVLTPGGMPLDARQILERYVRRI